MSMAHTTSVYYRDRLGFEPDFEPHRSQFNGGSKEKNGSSMRGESGHYVGTRVGNGRMDTAMPGGVYEENLTKFKGRNDGLKSDKCTG